MCTLQYVAYNYYDKEEERGTIKMHITMDMLLFTLHEKNPAITIFSGEETVYIKQVRVNAKVPSNPEPGALYLSEDRLFTGKKNASYATGVTDADLVIQCWNDILVWQNQICEQILEPDSFDSVMSLGKRFFHHNYILVDKEMQLLYVSDRNAPDITTRIFLSDDQTDLSEEMAQALLSERDFHLVINRKKPFYYHFLYTDSYSYCRNIFHNQIYYFRLVMYLKDNETVLGKGEEDFFNYFSEKVQQLCSAAIKSGFHQTLDLLHHVCHALLLQDSIEPTTVSIAMQQAGWLTEHNFLVMKMIYLENSGWKVAPEISLPSLVIQLEKLFPESCALAFEKHVICIINLSKLYSDASSEKEELQLFYRQLATFIREYVCHAGISAIFHDMLQIPDAADEADYALRTGELKQPQYWYYLFEDFHLAYLLDTLEKQLPSLALQDRMLSSLENYDRVHEDALVETLKAYLDHGMNMTKAAEGLYIHRTTFCRRMDRIRSITNLDLDDSKTVLKIWILLNLA